MEILISGMSCSGKTTLSNKILERFNDVSILRQDDYFKNRKDIPRDKNDFFLYDNPYAFDISLFVTDVYRLLHDGYVYSPIYDVRSNTRTNERRKINRSEINVIEGLHSIGLLGKSLDALKIYLDINEEECLKRRVIRDMSKYNMNEDEIRRYFYEIMIPQYKKYIEYQKDEANIIVSNSNLYEVIKLIRRKI